MELSRVMKVANRLKREGRKTGRCREVNVLSAQDMYVTKLKSSKVVLMFDIV